MSLYLSINLLTIAFPLALSFDRRVRFVRSWGSVLPAIFLSGLIFGAWDAWFTRTGVWGFNPAYLTGLSLGDLPIEEVLFFLTVPYACLFTLAVLAHYAPGYRLSAGPTRMLALVLVSGLAVGGVVFIGRTYTAVNFLFTAGLLLWVLIRRPEVLEAFFPAYLVILFPFLLINGVLTGSFIEGEVVWYNPREILGLRLGTIPVEDAVYGLGLLLLNRYLADLLATRLSPKTTGP
ncbi:MAG: lycopene cyclase domain-containing protein [Bacteroidales bacterium]